MGSGTGRSTAATFDPELRKFEASRVAVAPHLTVRVDFSGSLPILFSDPQLTPGFLRYGKECV